MKIVKSTITKINVIFLVFVLFAGIFTAISSPSSFISKVQAQKSEESKEKENKCISYNKSEKLISINCKYANFEDISKQITDPEILKLETPSVSNNSNSNNEKVWLLNAGLKVEENALLGINSKDVTWLKMIPSKNSPNAIEVDGTLKVDSVKITSWNPKTNDYVYFSDAVKYDELQYKKELRPYIKVNSEATGPTIIQNSELAIIEYFKISERS